MRLRQAPLLLELQEPLDDLDPLLERVHADRVAGATGADGERPVPAVRALAVHDDPEDPDPGRDGRDRERLRVRGRLGHDRTVGPEARLQDGSGAERVLHHLLPDHRVQLEVAPQGDLLVVESLGDGPHRGAGALHVRRAEPVQPPVAELGVPGAAAEPAVRVDRRDRVDVRVQDERPAPARAGAHADEVPPLRVDRDPVRLEARLSVAGLEELVHARLAADHLLPHHAGQGRRGRVHAHELLEERDRLVSQGVDPGQDALAGVHHTGSGFPLASERLAARETRNASSACSPVPFSGRRPCSRQETNSSISGPQGSTGSSRTSSGSPSLG